MPFYTIISISSSEIDETVVGESKLFHTREIPDMNMDIFNYFLIGMDVIIGFF